jgi:hypothetical protein
MPPSKMSGTLPEIKRPPALSFSRVSQLQLPMSRAQTLSKITELNIMSPLQVLLDRTCEGICQHISMYIVYA